MSYQNKEILRDKNNRPIPQIWSEDLQDFVPYTGNVAEVQAIKDDLALMKATLGQVKELLTSGEQKVTLSDDLAKQSTLSTILSGLNTMQDEQGRIYGQDGSGNWRPIRINSSGQLELASDVTVNVGAEVAVYNRNDEPLKVQQSDPIVKVLADYSGIPYDYVPPGGGGLLTGPYNELLFGEDVYGPSLFQKVRYLDCSEYPHVDIAIMNRTDVDLTYRVFGYPYGGQRENQHPHWSHPMYRELLLEGISTGGKTGMDTITWLRSVDEPKLNRVAGLVVILSPASDLPTEGHVYVLIKGSKI